MSTLLFDEAAADARVRVVLHRLRSRLCLTAAGYRLLCVYGINLNGGYVMPQPLIFKAPDGSIQEVVESETLTLEGLDNRIAEATEHVAYLQDLRATVVSLEAGGDAPAAAPANGDVTPPAGVPTPPAAPADSSAPAAPAPGQPQIDANGNPVAADPAATPPPAVNS